jgi:molybdopterin synthase catalytic subunit
MPARLTADRLDLVDALHAWRATLPAGRDGALACFIGSMRDFNASDRVRRMTLEHYPAMTQAELDRYCAEAMSRWPLGDILIVHRYGELEPGDDIVLVACTSAHRAAAFEACRETMERLKRDAPFWKHETTDAGERWVHDIADKDDDDATDD